MSFIKPIRKPAPRKWGADVFAGTAYDDAFIDLEKTLEEYGVSLEQLDANAFDSDESGTYAAARSALGFVYIKSVYDKYKGDHQSLGSHCVNCGCVMDYTTTDSHEKTQFTVDHIMSVAKWARSQRGSFSKEQAKAWFNRTDNWQPMCRSCNSSKGG